MRVVSLLYRIWWSRQAAFVPFREAAARLYEQTKAADVLLPETGTVPRPTACLEYHARQLVRFAKYGKATFYGKRTSASSMEPIPHSDLWAGKYADDMSRWIAENGIEYLELSLRHSDLTTVIQSVRQAVKDHDALLAWCRRHAPSRS